MQFNYEGRSVKMNKHKNTNWSGRPDLNRRPLVPKTSVLTKLNYFPINGGADETRTRVQKYLLITNLILTLQVLSSS